MVHVYMGLRDTQLPVKNVGTFISIASVKYSHCQLPVMQNSKLLEFTSAIPKLAKNEYREP